MHRLPALQRTATAVALVLTAALSILSEALVSDLPDGAAMYRAIAAAGTTATVSALAFLCSQLPFGVAMVGVARALRDRHRVLAPLIATFAVLGTFGHTAFGGMSIVQLAMSRDLAHADVHAATMERAYGMATPFAAFGLLGTVLASVLVAVAVLRGGLGPRWAGAVLLGFVVVEFVGTGLTVWAVPASLTLGAVAFGTLAVAVARTPLSRWTTAAEAARTSEDPSVGLTGAGVVPVGEPA